ncbi:hypothetical protein [Cohnella massiliensis]|uniref:hypothetical protein n=1 Tax=Cohnella massiliensis TaxID=1816691 RepID=UPI0009B9E9C4|nr:hypothetical protein [Cohnella massiliensis]
MVYHTPDTTRIALSDPEALSIAVSQMIYPSRTVSWRANSVILVSGDDFRTIVPAVSLIHFPINAPILFVNHGTLSELVWNEINRLQPAGKNVPHVILIGEFNPSAIQQLHGRGYTTLHFHHSDPVVQSIHIAEWRKRLLPDTMPEMVTKNTFLISVEESVEALPAYGFAAHMGTPFLYTYKDSLPEWTARFLTNEATRNVSIIGSTNTVSAEVEEACRKIVQGHVERFGGESPEDIAVNFSRTKSEATGMGWGRNEIMKGDAFTFFPAFWKYGMITAPLSHMGKHTPQLPLTGTVLPKVYLDYLQYLRPMAAHPMPPFMHAFILGDFHQIPFSTQVEIEKNIMFMEFQQGTDLQGMTHN